jgi:biotin carboxyl carrier protein
MKAFTVTVNGKAYDVAVDETGANGKTQPTTPAKAEESVAVKPVASAATPPNSAAESGEIPVNAPLTGTIMSLKVKPGDAVQNGQALLTLEALKMENEIVAPQAGVIKEINVQIGKTVNVGDIMLTLRS